MYEIIDLTPKPASSVGFAEIKKAVTERNVTSVALIGYSHGGGSVYEVSQSMDADPTSFNLDLTAYIDAIKQPYISILTEDRRPTNTTFHVNYYQEFQLSDLIPLQGGPSLPSGAGDEDNVDYPTPTETHITIDDDAGVQGIILNHVKQKINP
jgi:hypothetical protein